MALTTLDRLGDLILLTLLDHPDGADPQVLLDQIAGSHDFAPSPEDLQPDPDRPGYQLWRSRSYIAQRHLVTAQWLRVDRQTWALTPAGRAAAEEARRRRAGHDDRPVTKLTGERRLLRPSVMATPLLDPDERARIGFPVNETAALPVLVELNVRYQGGLDRAYDRLLALHGRITGTDAAPHQAPHRLTEDFVQLRLPMTHLETLVEADAADTPSPRTRAIHRVWPDFPVQPLVDASSRTIKADAARRSFSALGEGVVWAVIDSGIDQEHPHFQTWATLTHPDVADLHRDFTVSLAPGIETAATALVDERGHGSHVAGIIAGGLPPAGPGGIDPVPVLVLRDEFADLDHDGPGDAAARGYARDLLAGMAPRARLVSLKALPPEEDSEMSRVIAALRYVREANASSDRLMRIHGVNVSLGYEFDPLWFACGHSPLCREVDRLVRTGVVVVVAAGNTGYGRFSASTRQTNASIAMTINDPGNADRAITVGSTHRDRPHTYGVSYFSSKGPTGDGRPKPDLIAPGERITSCAAGGRASAKHPGGRPPGTAMYVEDSGTSMAAPHVSGAVAAFLSVRAEFIGQPERVKEIFCRTATPLGREHYFQGAGLVDLMRALQHV